MKKTFQHEEGQSIIIIAAALVGLVALMAMVVDAGNAYVQRRQTQNAVDAATQAGTIAFTQNKTGSQILSEVKKYAGSNGMDTNRVTAYYIVQDTLGNQYVVYTPPVGTGLGKDNVITQTNYGTLGVLPIVGIQVVGDKEFPTYFAGVIGFNTMSTRNVSASFAKCGACSANSLFPVAIAANLFTLQGVHTEQLDPPGSVCPSPSCYVLYENRTGVSQGSYGYVQWPGSTNIASNMNNTENNVSGSWRVNDPVSGNSTTTADSSIVTALQSRVAGSLNQFVTVPVYDTASPGLTTPGPQTYNIKGFARFRITGYYFGSTSKGGNYASAGTIVSGDKFIVGRLQQWDDPQANGGCANFGICAVKSNPPITETRALIGSVKINKLTLSNTTPTNVHVPADVMEVIDLSPSMNNDFNNNSTGDINLKKITAARAALNKFNDKLVKAKQANPTWTDQLGLTVFPKTLSQTSPAYYTPCRYVGPNNKLFTTYQTGELKYDLGGTVSSMQALSNTIGTIGLPSGNTPTAGAIKVARTSLLGANHIATNLPIMIIATDGRANVLINNQFNGDNIDLDPCNNQALIDATNEATTAKSDNNRDGLPDTTIFVVASGSEYKTNPTLQSYFKALATVDTNPSLKHFFAADSAADLDNAFTEIFNRIDRIGDETCKVIQTEATGSGFNLTATNTGNGKTYPITTTSTGDFVIPRLDPGTYTFSTVANYVDGLNYNIFTLGVGGADGSTTVTVGNDTGTYRVDLFLRASNQVSCNK